MNIDMILHRPLTKEQDAYLTWLLSPWPESGEEEQPEESQDIPTDRLQLKCKHHVRGPHDDYPQSQF